MNIKSKLISTYLAIAIIPVVITGFIGLYLAQTSIEEETFRSLETVVASKASAAELFITGLEDITESFGSDGYIAKTLFELNNNFDMDLSKELSNYLIKNKKSLDNRINLIDVVDNFGVVVASTDLLRVGEDIVGEDYFLNEGRSSFVSDIHMGPEGISVGVSSAVLEVSGDRMPIGSLVNHFNAEDLNKIMTGGYVESSVITDSPRGIGVTGETYAVNIDKLMLNESLFFEDSILKQTVDTYPVDACFENNQNVTGTWNDYRGVLVVGSSVCLDLDDFVWAIVSEQDRDEAFAGVRRLGNVTGLIGLGVLLIVFMIALLASSSISAPIVRLTMDAEEISKGNFKHKTKIKSQDEIGALAKAFNIMTSSLSRSSEEIVNKNKELEGQQLAVMNVLEDVREEKEKTDIEKDRVKALVDGLTDGVVMFDADKKSTIINQAMVNLTGLPMEGFYLDELTKLFATGKVNLESQLNEALSSKKTTFVKELPFAGFVYQAVIVPILKDDGGIHGGAIIIHDITKEKEIEHAKTEFVSIASHQLRTPMTGLKWTIERFIKKEKISEKGQEYLKDMHYSMDRLTDLVDSLLNVSRIETGGVSVEPKKFDLIEFIDKYLAELTGLVQKKKQKLVFDDHPASLSVDTDPNVLRNVVQSLISNAIEYTPDGGTITVSIEPKDKRYDLKVVDTGIGIPKEDMSKLFQKFHRSENAKMFKADGTGLGLYITKNAIELLGGKILVESVVEKGTTFTVDLPLISPKREGNKTLL